MNKIIEYVYSLYRLLFSASIPDITFARIFKNTLSDWKVSAMVKAKCGLLVCTYNNVTRRNAAIVLLNPQTGEMRQLIATNAETYGRPVLRDGKWYFPQEENETPIVIVDDKTGAVSRGRKHPTDYSTCGIETVFPVVGRDGRSYPWIWDFITGKSGHRFKSVRGIVSDIVRDNGQYVIAVQDGSPGGIEWENGQFLTDAASGLEKIGTRLIAFFKSGNVRVVSGGKRGEIIAMVGRKFVRTTQHKGLIFAVTSNPDSLVLCNGYDVAVAYTFPGNDLTDGTASGSLFDGDVAVEGKYVWVARSLHRGGYEVWRGKM